MPIDRMVARLNLDPDEVEEWLRRAEACASRSTTTLGIHPQDSALPRARGLGPAVTGDRQAAAAAALSPAGDLPVPGAQAGRRRAGAVPAGAALHGRAEAQGLRVLRPDHDRRLDVVGRGAVDHRRRGRLRRPGACATSSRGCTSTWPTCTATRPTASTSRRRAASGARWRSGSAACATTAAGSRSIRDCRSRGTR